MNALLTGHILEGQLLHSRDVLKLSGKSRQLWAPRHQILLT